jgi:hypothetical protein
MLSLGAFIDIGSICLSQVIKEVSLLSKGSLALKGRASL